MTDGLIVNTGSKMLLFFTGLKMSFFSRRKHRSIIMDRPVFLSWNAARGPACNLSCDKSFR